MLHQALPPIDSTPLDGWGRWLAPALVAGCGADGRAAAPVLGPAGLGRGRWSWRIGRGGHLLPTVRPSPVRREALAAGPDYALVGSALGMCRDPAR